MELRIRMGMKNYAAAFIYSIVLVAGMIPFARGAATQNARKSADGVELPPALPQRKFHPAVPLAGQILGQKPEEVGRVFNCKHSAALLAKRTSQDLGCEWFVINVSGADVVGLGLTDGRVSRLVLFYAVASPTKIANLRKQIESKPDPLVKATICPIEVDKKPSLKIIFEAEPIEFYLAGHPVDAAVADALRRRTWIESMNDEQAMLVGDGPGKYQATFGPENGNGDGKPTSAIFNDIPADTKFTFDARNKADAHRQALAKNKNLKELVKIENAK